MVKEEDGRREAKKLVLVQNPSKTDPEGERGFEKGFIIDQDPKALSAGKDFRDMLRDDRDTDDREATPLLRDKVTRQEVTYEASSERMLKEIQEAIIAIGEFRTYKLRVGAPRIMRIQ